MNTKNNVWAIFFLIISIILIIIGIVSKGYFIFIYGIPIFIITIGVFLNKNEDKIEKIKTKKRS